jgi:hypothetical protein
MVFQLDKQFLDNPRRTLRRSSFRLDDAMTHRERGWVMVGDGWLGAASPSGE